MKILASVLAAIMVLCILGVASIVVLMPSCSWWGGGGGGGGWPSPIGGTFEIDVVTFELDQAHGLGATSGIGPPSSGPGIRIDTNTEVCGLWGGTVKSERPYAIGFDFTDNAGDLASLRFTRLEVTYDDGGIEPAGAALGLPMTIGAREIETINSGSGGAIIRSTVRILSGEIGGVITRDEPFRLVIEGRFIRTDGSGAPFTIDQRWEPRFEQTTRPVGEVLQDK